MTSTPGPFNRRPLDRSQDRNGTRWPEIAIVGSFPPPYGGISVHLQRLAARLEAQGYDFVLYNLRSDSERPPHIKSVFRNKYGWYLSFCFGHGSRIVHLFSENWYSRVAFALASYIRPGKYVLSIQGQITPDALKHRGWLQSRLTRWLLNRVDVVIACHPDIVSDCVDIAGVPKQRVAMVPAFIPPDPERSVPLPAHIQDYIDNHSPVLSAVGWLGEMYDGVDLYGLDQMVELVARLRQSYQNIGLVYSFNTKNPEELEASREDIRRRVGDHVLLVSEPLEDVNTLMTSSALFLRPTNTDGDSVSIREALFLKVPAVASDAVPRPDGCVTFRTRDIDDFERKVRDALEDLPELKRGVETSIQPDNAGAVLAIYDTLRAAS